MDDGNGYLPTYLVYACICEEQCWVIMGHHRAVRNKCVGLLLETVNEHLSELLALSFIVKYWVQEILVVLLFTFTVK